MQSPLKRTAVDRLRRSAPDAADDCEIDLVAVPGEKESRAEREGEVDCCQSDDCDVVHDEVCKGHKDTVPVERVPYVTRVRVVTLVVRSQWSGPSPGHPRG